MNLTQKLELFRQQADALAKTIEDTTESFTPYRGRRWFYIKLRFY